MYLLLVDYDFIPTNEMQKILEQTPDDTDIVNCYSAATLLRIAEKLDPDIIVIDFAKVENDLANLFSDLREKSPDAHVLALIDPEYYDKLYRAIETGGVDDYIVKPVRREDFMARLQLAAKKKSQDTISAEPAGGAGEQKSGQVYEFESYPGKQKADLDEGLAGDTELSAPPDEEAAFDEPPEGGELSAGPGPETPEQEAGPEEEGDVFDNLEFLSEDEFEAGGPEEDETELTGSYEFEAVEPEKPGDEDSTEEDITPEEDILELEDTGYGVFEDDPETLSEKDDGEEDLSGLFEEEKEPEDGQPEPVESGDGFKSFEEIITEPPEEEKWGSFEEEKWEQIQEDEKWEPVQEEKWDQPEDEYELPEAGESGTGAVKPAAEFLDGEILHDISQDQETPGAQTGSGVSGPDEENYFEDLFDESPAPAEKTPGTGEQETDWGMDQPEEGTDFQSSEQATERLNLREFSSLPGRTADEFLFGVSEEEEGENFSAEDEEISAGQDEREDEGGESGPGKKRKSGRGGFSKFLTVFGNIVFALLLLLMATLSFFLIQSRIAGGVPEVAGYQMYIVLSGSMSPEFDTGSLAFVRETDTAELRVGDIITFRSQADSDSLTTHRIVEILQNDTTRFVTRGDANNVNDPNPVPEENVVGRVEGSVPYVGYLLNFVQTRQGLILLIFVPGVLIIVYELGKIMKYLTQGGNGKGRQKSGNKEYSRLAEK